MALIASLAQAGITRKELQGLEAGDIIRIEKRLVAEQRLNGTLSKNDVEQVMYVLKNYAPELQEIAGYDGLWGILTGVDAGHADHLRTYSAKQLDRMKQLVSGYFEDELTAYINKNLVANHWSNLRLVWCYEPFFKGNIIYALSNRLEIRMRDAIKLLNQHPPKAVLNKRLAYLKSGELYLLLSEVDEWRFTFIISDFFSFIDDNVGYARHNRFFFIETCIALSKFKSYDATLDDRRTVAILKCMLLRTETPKAKKIRYILAAVVAIVVTLVIGILVQKSNGGLSSEPVATTEKDTTDIIKVYHPEADSATDEHGKLLTRNHFWQTDTSLQMYTFAQARMYPVNYPFESWKTSRIQIDKYANPFAPAIFEKDNRKVRQLNGPIINLFNQTDKGCVAIAYYNSYFNADSNRYVRLKRKADEKIFAFYIPPQDSIRLDLKMMRLRFYMGSRLARFQVKGYHYPDSADTKFSKLTQADSVLFSNALVMNYHNYNDTREKYNLKISQPDEYRYQVYWGGKAINLYRTREDRINHKKNDDITQYQPLILDARDPADEQSRHVRSFIGWQ